MTTLLTALWADECGLVLSSEIVLVGTVAVLGIMTGLVCVRDAINDELGEVSDAFRSIDQSYSYNGLHGCTSRCGLSSYTAGSFYGNVRHASHSRVVETELGCRPCEIDEQEEIWESGSGTVTVPQQIETVPCPVNSPTTSPCPTTAPCPTAIPCPTAPCPPTTACPPTSAPQGPLIW